MSTKKRDPIKHVRDKAKAKYEKGTECRICGSTKELDFHHFHSLTPLFNKWLKERSISIETDEDVIAIREEFIAQHQHELYKATVTLCHTHHMALHSIYGKDPSLASASKQERWVEIQREKNGRSIVG